MSLFIIDHAVFGQMAHISSTAEMRCAFEQLHVLIKCALRHYDHSRSI